MRPHLDALMAAWKPGKGVGFSAGYSVTDGDDTIITYDVLNRFGYEVDIESVLSFEEESYFRCYDLEVGISQRQHPCAYGLTQHRLRIEPSKSAKGSEVFRNCARK